MEHFRTAAKKQSSAGNLWKPAPFTVITLLLWSQTAIAGEPVGIELTGTIEAHCNIKGLVSELDLGTLVKTGTKSLSFIINCNSPFSYRLTSLEGGLRLRGATNSIQGFTDLIPYRVITQIPTNSGLIQNDCESTTLTEPEASCNFPNSGGDIAIEQQAVIELSWSTNKDFRAGIYSDNLRLTLQPQL